MTLIMTTFTISTLPLCVCRYAEFLTLIIFMLSVVLLNVVLLNVVVLIVMAPLINFNFFLEFPDLSGVDGVHPSHAHANALTLELGPML